MWSRLKPAVSLFLLAPLIAEYLLGSLSFGQLALFPIMALMYGAGALLVREVTRRSGRGWPTILTLGLAYGVIEEGLATQSLFNPHYLGLRLLDYGYMPQLGIGAPWTVYVLILHLVWSIAVPIGFVEWLFSNRRTTPYLRTTGFVVSVITYAIGVALVTFGTRQQEKFTASITQLAVAAVIAVVLIVAAFVLFAPVKATPPDASRSIRWSPLNLGILSFVAGSIFHLMTQFGSAILAPWVAVLIALALPLSVIAVACVVEKSGGWTSAQSDGLMLGALLAYCWLGFFMTVRLHGASSLPGQFFPIAIIAGLVGWRLTRGPTPSTE